MSTQPAFLHADCPAYGYHLLKVALGSFRKPPGQLAPDQLQQARGKAQKSLELEDLVLGSPEASGVIVDAAQVDAAVAEVAGRYEQADDFEQDLARNDLDEATLRDALRRELVFDGVMHKIAGNAPGVDDLDVRLFYELHRDRFTVAEQRTARHILITVNSDFAENTPEAARARAETLAAKVGTKPNRFASLARQHSECPTALEGGKLGTVKPGQLFPELDAALFSMAEGEISTVIESEIGFHILWCEKVMHGKQVPLSKARPRIVELLQERKRRNCQKNWIAQLRRSVDGPKELS